MPIAPDLSGLALDGRYELHAIIGEGTFGRVYRGRDRRLSASGRGQGDQALVGRRAGVGEELRARSPAARLDQRPRDHPDLRRRRGARRAVLRRRARRRGESRQPVAQRSRGAHRGVRDRACNWRVRSRARTHSASSIATSSRPTCSSPGTGAIKVGDFGVARLAEGSTDASVATIAGTPGYMAPEQASGGISSPATDVYGVGIVLYEMLAGHTPFEGKSAVELALRHVNDPPPPLPVEHAPCARADRAVRVGEGSRRAVP